jgi:hypothetical protein
VFFRLTAKASFDGILVEIVTTDVVVGCVADAVVGEASLPDGEFGGESAREAAFDELHRALEGDVGWSDNEVDMIGHDDVGMQKIAGAVVVDGFKEERGVAFNLKETAAVVGGCGDEVSAGSGGAARDRHSAIVKRTSAAEQVAENAVLLKHCGSPRP